MIPLFLRLRIEEDSRTKINLPLPLFIVWILLLCLTLVLLPLLLIAAVVYWILGNNLRILCLFPKTLSLLCALPGLLIQVEGNKKRVDLLIL